MAPWSFRMRISVFVSMGCGTNWSKVGYQNRCRKSLESRVELPGLSLMRNSARRAEFACWRVAGGGLRPLAAGP
jgi:hypothetical protein